MSAVPQPSGTVTLVFSDIEGSTRLLHELGTDAYREALTEHRRVVREAFGRYSGYEVDYEGDAFFYAFSSANDAVSAVSEAMQGLKDGPISIRVGIHTGEPGLDPPKYVGMDVHLATRVMSSAHGGQVVCSNATAELVEGPLTDLGEHRLKDIEGAVPIYQLLEGSFPPLKTISNTNLPRPASSFLGREAELREVLSRIEAGARLVTLTGPGGTGKTRLALEAATSLVGEYKAGVFWVGLASLRDPALVIDTISQTLGAKDELAKHVGERELLLLLDNLEQVIEAAADLSQLLSSCPNLALLVTSRELLRIQGEVEYPVPPLAQPEAVSLFCERAQLPPTADIAELCARLDNLPLAVELAAARTKALTVAQILERLSQRLDLLKGGRDADPRQQTLRATIEWSYDLLDPEEQQLFARLSVFAGGCTLEAAEEVCDGSLDTLQSLVEKSLLRFTDGRYWMLETIREYAGGRLEGSGAEEAAGRRHADYYVELAERVEHRILEADAPVAVQLLDAEHDNFRQVLIAHRASDPVALTRLAAALARFWYVRGYVSEGRAWLEEAATRDVGSPSLRAKVLFGLSILLDSEGEYAQAIDAGLASVELYRELDPEGLADALNNLGNAAGNLGEYEDAQKYHEEAITLSRGLGDGRRMGRSLLNLGGMALARHDYDGVASLTEEALPYLRNSGDSFMLAMAVSNLGCVDLKRGRWSEAAAFFRESLALAVDQRSPELSACLLTAVAALVGNTDPSRGARLLGATDALLDGTGVVLPGFERELYDTTARELEERLDHESFDAARNEGRAIDPEDAVEYAFSSLD